MKMLLALLSVCVLICLFLFIRKRYWVVRLGHLKTIKDAQRWAHVIASDYIGFSAKDICSLDFIFSPSPLAVPYRQARNMLSERKETIDEIAAVVASMIQQSTDYREKYGGLLLISLCWPSEISKKTILDVASNPEDECFDVCIRCLYFNVDSELASDIVNYHKQRGAIDRKSYKEISKEACI